MLSKREQELLDVLEGRAEQEHVEIVTLEIVGAKKSPTIRVYIDTDHGVSFDELASAQSWINELMDELDPFPGAYTLEVSSPGIDRPLRTLDHFRRYRGQDCTIKTTSPIDGRASFSATIVDVEEGSVAIECDGRRYEIPLSSMRRANLKGSFEFSR